MEQSVGELRHIYYVTVCSLYVITGHHFLIHGLDDDETFRNLLVLYQLTSVCLHLVFPHRHSNKIKKCLNRGHQEFLKNSLDFHKLFWKNPK